MAKFISLFFIAHVPIHLLMPYVLMGIVDCTLRKSVKKWNQLVYICA